MTYKFCLFNLMLCLLIGCAEPKVELEPGEILTDVIDNFKNVKDNVNHLNTETTHLNAKTTKNTSDLVLHNKKAKIEEDKENELKALMNGIKSASSNLSNEDSISLRRLENDKIILLLKINSLSIEMLSENKVPVSDNAKDIYEIKYEKGNLSIEPLLTPKGETFFDEVVIISNQFHIEKGKTFSTLGTNLTILSNYIKIEGTLSTTPPDAEYDHPGMAGGNLRMAAIEIEKGNDSLIQTSGGAAGKIISKPNTLLKSSAVEWKTIKNDIEENYIETVEYEIRDRLPRVGDAKKVMDTWEALRPRLTADFAPWAFDEALYGKGHYLQESVGDRLAFLRENRSLHLNFVGALIEATLKEKNNDHRTTSVTLMINGKFSVSVKEQVLKDRIKDFQNNQNLIQYPVPAVMYEPLPGGASGTIEVVSALDLPLLHIKADEGRVSEKPESFPLYKNSSLSVRLNEIRQDILNLAVRKDWSDKDSLPIVEERIFNINNETRNVPVKFVQLNEDTPQIRTLYAKESQPDEVTASSDKVNILQSTEALVQVDESWGLSDGTTGVTISEEFKKAKAIFSRYQQALRD